MSDGDAKHIGLFLETPAALALRDFMTDFEAAKESLKCHHFDALLSAHSKLASELAKKGCCALVEKADARIDPAAAGKRAAYVPGEGEL